MRYFDRMLSEALDKDKPKVSQQDREQIFRTLSRLQDALEKDPQDEKEIRRLMGKIEEWRKKYPGEMDEIELDAVKKLGKPKLQEKLRQAKYDRTDNLATWMLRHLVSKAQSG